MGLVDAEKIALLNLLAIPGIGSWGAIRLVKEFGQPSKVFSAGDGALRSVPRVGEKAIEAIHKANPQGETGKQQFESAEKCGAKVISFWDDEYPQLLKELEQDAPAVLFVRGSLPTDARRVAFVGTRRASDYGRRACKELINGLAGSGISIVSGLASGIDGAAHQAALERSLSTEAVFGCGIDIIYPDGHKTLAQKILDAGGALISEYAPGTQPSGFTFPQRNRIIAGMSLATVVIEAPEKSGALITSRLAGSYGREVGAVPGFVIGGKAAGCHELIKEGAALIDCAQDILDLIKVSTRAAQAATAPAPNLAEPERALWDLIPADDKIHIDVMAEKAGQGTGEVLSRLLMMELKGYIRQLPGKFFVRA
jgi:DNA processing protein